MCTDTAIHRRQAGQECSWTNTDCETTAAPRFTTPLFGLFIVCCPWCLFPLYLSIYQSCHHFYLCLVILCCHARVSVWFPFSILHLLTVMSKFNFCSQLVLSHRRFEVTVQKQSSLQKRINIEWCGFLNPIQGGLSCQGHTKDEAWI